MFALFSNFAVVAVLFVLTVLLRCATNYRFCFLMRQLGCIPMTSLRDQVLARPSRNPITPITSLNTRSSHDNPADTKRWINVCLTLVQPRRRWTNVKPTLIQRLVSAANSLRNCENGVTVSDYSSPPPPWSGPVFSYKWRHIVGFWLVEMAISTNQKPTIYRNLYENTGPETNFRLPPLISNWGTRWGNMLLPFSSFSVPGYGSYGSYVQWFT